MMEVYEVLIRPIVNEKTINSMPQKKYAFEVFKNSNKIEIADAVEKIFKVKVGKVNVSHVRSRLKRKGKTKGYTASWKKAVVTLKPDSKGIEFFEGLN